MFHRCAVLIAGHKFLSKVWHGGDLEMEVSTCTQIMHNAYDTKNQRECFKFAIYDAHDTTNQREGFELAICD